MPTIDSQEKVLAKLKHHAPAKVRAYITDEEYRDIAVPTRRKKWGQVIETLYSQAWMRVELMTKSGELLATIDNTEPARGLEELGETKTNGEHALALRIVELVIKAQRDAMTFRDAEMQALLKAQGDVVREMAEGMRAVTALYKEQVGVAADVAAMNERAQQGDGGFNVKELIEAAPTIMQALPMLRAMLTGEAPNGVRKS